VANKFRALWGKEAGWAHSVLFTADLRAFSDRLVEKVEKVEKVETFIKMEDGEVPLEVVKETKVMKRRIKVEDEAVPVQLTESSPRSVRASKRRRIP
jgi:N-glycosylase/DNA lyase